MAFTKVVGAGIHTLSNITSHNVHSSGIITATRFDGPFTNLNITGVATFAGDVSIGGTLTYEDVTNIDSVGIVTARDGIFIPDNKKAHFGNAAGSGDLQIFHDSSGGHSRIDDTGTGGLVLRGSNILLEKYGGGYLGNFKPDNSVDLFYAGNKKFETTNTGAIVTGILTATNGLDAIGIQSGGVNITTGIITAINFVGAGNTFKVDGTTVDISIQGGGGGGGTGGGAFTTSVTGIQTTSQIVGIGTTSTDDPDLQGIGNTAKGVYVSNGMFINDNKLNGNHYIATSMNSMMAGPITVDGVLTVHGSYVVL